MKPHTEIGIQFTCPIACISQIANVKRSPKKGIPECPRPITTIFWEFSELILVLVNMLKIPA